MLVVLDSFSRAFDNRRLESPCSSLERRKLTCATKEDEAPFGGMGSSPPAQLGRIRGAGTL
eukprot:4215464-Prorocentrum_lima.AAC.1